MHILETNLKFPRLEPIIGRIIMNSAAGSSDGYLWSLYEAMREKELKKLRIAKCPVCNKTNVYRLFSLGEAELYCKSCKAQIKVERYKRNPQV
jgi:tRNA(Ile2) C34 agmatinyltransferase TiaS